MPESSMPAYKGPAMYGLITSHNIAAANGVDPYKPAKFLDDSQWWGNKAQSPVNTQWTAPDYKSFNYQKYDSGGADPTYKTFNQAAPTYKGFGGGDYDRYELNLRAPGEQAAKRAYDTAKRDLSDAYSSNGMYGSSQFTRQMDSQVNRSYIDSLTNNAASAATQRYGFQAQDQQFAQQQSMAAWQAKMSENQAANQMDLSVWQNRMAENQLMNNLAYQDNAANNAWTWNASTAQRDWNDAQAMRQVNYNNMMAQSRQDWDMQRIQWDAQQNEAAWNRTYNIWKDVDPEWEHYQKKAIKTAGGGYEKQSSGIGDLISSGGGMLGGLISNIPGWGQIAGPLISAGSKIAGGAYNSSESGNWSSTAQGISGAMPKIQNAISAFQSFQSS